MAAAAFDHRQTLHVADDAVASLAPGREALHFVGHDGPIAVDCTVTRAVLEQLEGARLDVAGCMNAFRKHRSAVIAMAARQYWLYGPNPEGAITGTLADL
jgi:hypothetical protein